MTETLTHSDKVTYLQYVPFEQIEAFKEKGWIVVDDFAGAPHGFYAVLMKYMGEGEPT